MSEQQPFECCVCHGGGGFRWTDTHGVAAHSCGMPYRLIHYEGDGADAKRVDKPPHTLIKEEWIPVAQAYWKETGRMVFPGEFDMGILSGRDRTYSGATKEDMDHFWGWVKAHPELVPEEQASE